MRVIVRRERACHSFCVSPGWSIIGPPFGRTQGVICDQGHNVAGLGEVGGSAAGGDALGRDAGLVDQGRGEVGHPIDGADGLLNELTKAVLECALQTEMTLHLGYESGDPAGRGSGNSRYGSTSKTVTTVNGPVTIDVPRDRNGSFEPAMVPKKTRRLGNINSVVLSLFSRAA